MTMGTELAVIRPGLTEEQVGRQVLRRTEQRITGCREFIGSLSPSGYGKVKIAGRVWSAHRAVWSVVNGEIPDGMEVCHHCDNPPCVEITHLFLGTREENQRDMYAKGRGLKASGEGHGRALLTYEDVQAIRQKRAHGVSFRTLASAYGVSKSAIHSAATGKTWRAI